MSYENICFEGGGIKVIAFCGALEVLEENGCLEDITRIIGSSGGAIVAAAMACGFTAKEMKEDLLGDDLSIMTDRSCWIGADLLRIFTKFGLYKGDAFEEWLRRKLFKKTGKWDPTFRDIYDIYQKVLVITGACLNKRQTHYYHYQSNPNMSIIKAVRISISLPFFFQAIFWDGDVLVDGGTFNNYPIAYFDGIDDCGNLPNSKEGIVQLNHRLNNKTIGLKLLSEGEQAGGGLVFTGNDRISSMRDFIESIVNSYGTLVENLYIKKGYWERTVSIYTGNIGTTKFTLTTSEKEFLLQSGREGAEKFLKKVSSSCQFLSLLS